MSEEYVRRLLASQEPIEAIQQIVGLWGPRVRAHQRDERLGLTEPEYMAHVVIIYDGEVGNGGHAQFFQNRGGRYVAAIGSAFEKLGLAEPRALLLEAVSVFPGGAIPESEEQTERTIAALPAEAWQRWAELDRRYYKLNGSIDAALLVYLRAHDTEVLMQERAP